MSVKFKPGISLIIPSYQGRTRLALCLNSVFQQTITHELFEIIIIINGADDGSRAYLQDLARQHPKYSLVSYYTPLAGVSHARNIGVHNAQHEFIAFLDDDDQISENYLAALLKYSDSEALILCQLQNVQSQYVAKSLQRSYQGQAMTASPDLTDAQLVAASRVRNWAAIITVMRVLTMNACKLVPTKYMQQFSFDTNLKSSEDMVFFSALYISRNLKLRVVPQAEAACYYRVIRPKSVSWQPVSFDFNLRQRFAVILAILKHIDNYSKLLNPVKLLFFLSRILGEILYSLRIIINNLKANLVQMWQKLAGNKPHGS